MNSIMEIAFIVEPEGKGSMEEIVDALTVEGFHIVRVKEEASALSHIHRLHPDILIIPGGSAKQRHLCTAIRKITDAPMITIFNDADEISQVSMLEAGADVYLEEPVGKLESVARVHALLRRYRKSSADNQIEPYSC